MTVMGSGDMAGGAVTAAVRDMAVTIVGGGG